MGDKTAELIVSDELPRPREVAVNAPPHPHDVPGRDLRHMIMLLPVEKQNEILADYKEKRDNFRDWILSQMVEGLHYGYAPGTEPDRVRQGNEYGFMSYVRGKKVFVSEKNWKPKPMLYAAGADFLCDLLLMRSVFELDQVAWEQLGSQSGVVAMKCTLYNVSGETLAEGRGAHKAGDRGGEENKAIKMAEKSAKVDAVISCNGLRDLFVQDGPPKNPHDNPEEDVGAPKAPTRAQRGSAISKDELADLAERFKQCHPEYLPDDLRSKFKRWCIDTTGHDFDVFNAIGWTRDNFKKCSDKINEIHEYLG